MSNPTEVDYEKQFQEDLAKATALSLEQEALDEYNRAKKYGSAYAQSSQQEAKNKLYAQLRRQQYARTSSSGENNANTTPQHALSLPKLQQSQRRHSEVNNYNTSIASTSERSKTPPPTTSSSSSSAMENDLINFASPTSKNPESSSFEKLIEDLQKLQTTNPQTALVPLGPTAAAPIYPSSTSQSAAAYPTAAGGHNMYPSAAAQAAQYNPAVGGGGAAAAGGMQLVPFVPTAQQQRVPLTNDELKKLYSMTPHTAPVYGPRPPAMGFMQPAAAAAGYYATPPPPPHMMVAGAGGAPYTAPLHYSSNAYGFQFQAMPPGQPYYAATTAAAAAASSFNSPMASGGVNVNHLSHSGQAFPPNPNSNANSSTNTNSFNPIHSSASGNLNQSMGSAAASSISAGSTASSAQSNGFNARRQTPPARKMSTRVPGSDLIDLSHEDDSRVSVLEAFDPLLNENSDVTKRLTK